MVGVRSKSKGWDSFERNELPRAYTRRKNLVDRRGEEHSLIKGAKDQAQF